MTQIDSQELSMWMAYDNIEPLDDPYWRTGLECSTMAAVFAGKQMKPEDFIPSKRQKPDGKKKMIDSFEQLKRKQGAVSAPSA